MRYHAPSQTFESAINIGVWYFLRVWQGTVKFCAISERALQLPTLLADYDLDCNIKPYSKHVHILLLDIWLSRAV
jgi:hypothetical protein